MREVVDCIYMDGTRILMKQKDGGYVDMITKLILKVVAEMSSTEPLDTNCLYEVPKDRD